MSSPDLEMERTVIEFYREEIRRRYRLENMRRFDSFESISDTDLDVFREFFLDSIYPAMEMRAQIDEAFDVLSALLHSPVRLAPLMTTVLASSWRLGTRLPAAVSAGRSTVEALKKTRAFEGQMIRIAHGLGIGLEDADDRGAMLQIMAQLPEKAVLGLIHEVLRLFRALSNVKMLTSMMQIMERSVEVMDAKPLVYKRSEREGVRLGLGIVRRGVSLFERLKKRDFPLIIEGIERVEMDWYERLREETAA